MQVCSRSVLLGFFIVLVQFHYDIIKVVQILKFFY